MSGGDIDTLTNANVLIENHEIERPDYNVHANVNYAIDVEIGSCGFTFDAMNIHDLVDGALTIKAPNSVISDSMFYTINGVSGDAGAISAGYYWIPNVLIRNNDFTNFVRHPRQHISLGALYAIYAESDVHWTIEDNRWDNCDNPLNIAGGKWHTIRRNRWINKADIFHGAAMIFGNRLQYIGLDPHNSIQAQLASLPLDQEPWVSTYPLFIQYRSGGARSSIIAYHENIVFVDNATDHADAIARMVKFSSGNPGSSTWQMVGGFQVGVDPSQLNYPLSSADTIVPVEGGGTVELGDMSTD
jgi:hypothetical protein